MSSEPLLSRTVETENSGLRLDKFLSTWSEISTRSRAVHLIDEGFVRVNDKSPKASLVLKEGDLIQVRIPAPTSSNLVASDLELEILYEDDDIIVINKPSGLVVHPAAGHQNDTLVNALLKHTKNLSMGFGEQRPGIVHRLDKETSGLLVVAKNDRAQENLVQQFKARKVRRVYQAVCLGEVFKESGTVKSWLARHSNDRKRYASILYKGGKIFRETEPAPSHGKWAVTHYKRLAKGHGLSFLELKLETGRTHQIRIHLSEEGFPLAGDRVYGSDRKLKAVPSVRIREQIAGLDRFLLHARELGFTHPTTGKELHFERDWPPAEKALLHEWGFE